MGICLSNLNCFKRWYPTTIEKPFTYPVFNLNHDSLFYYTAEDPIIQPEVSNEIDII